MKPTRRAPARQHIFVVDHTERLTQHLVRVHLGGGGFDTFIEDANPDRLAATDTYAKLFFARAGLGLVPPYDLDALRQTLAPEDLPVMRTYTVRSIDRSARTIAIDFVVHGDEGIAGPWAASAQRGDLLPMTSPGGMYSPDTNTATEHLLLGDDSAIPAIAAALEAMPSGARGQAVIEVHDRSDEIELAHPEGVTLRWIHRAPSGRHVAEPLAGATETAAGTGTVAIATATGSGAAAAPGTALVAAVRDLPAVSMPVQVFAHGERGAMNAIRAVLQDDWGLERRVLSLSAYWAIGRAEDRFQAEKREPIGQIFAD